MDPLQTEGEKLLQAFASSSQKVPTMKTSKLLESENQDIEQAEISDHLNEVKEFLGKPTVEKTCNLSQAQWISELQCAKVLRKVGKKWNHFGHSFMGNDVLYAEEAAYLLEINNLELLNANVPLSLQKAFSLLLTNENGCSLLEYRVYSHFVTFGYRVFRHDPQLVSEKVNQVTLTEMTEPTEDSGAFEVKVCSYNKNFETKFTLEMLKDTQSWRSFAEKLYSSAASDNDDNSQTEILNDTEDAKNNSTPVPTVSCENVDLETNDTPPIVSNVTPSQVVPVHSVDSESSSDESEDSDSDSDIEILDDKRQTTSSNFKGNDIEIITPITNVESNFRTMSDDIEILSPSPDKSKDIEILTLDSSDDETSGEQSPDTFQTKTDAIQNGLKKESNHVVEDFIPFKRSRDDEDEETSTDSVQSKRKKRNQKKPLQISKNIFENDPNERLEPDESGTHGYEHPGHDNNIGAMDMNINQFVQGTMEQLSQAMGFNAQFNNNRRGFNENWNHPRPDQNLFVPGQLILGSQGMNQNFNIPPPCLPMGPMNAQMAPFINPQMGNIQHNIGENVPSPVLNPAFSQLSQLNQMLDGINMNIQRSVSGLYKLKRLQDPNYRPFYRRYPNNNQQHGNNQFGNRPRFNQMNNQFNGNRFNQPNQFNNFNGNFNGPNQRFPYQNYSHNNQQGMGIMGNFPQRYYPGDQNQFNQFPNNQQHESYGFNQENGQSMIEQNLDNMENTETNEMAAQNETNQRSNVKKEADDEETSSSEEETDSSSEEEELKPNIGNRSTQQSKSNQVVNVKKENQETTAPAGVTIKKENTHIRFDAESSSSEEESSSDEEVSPTAKEPVKSTVEISKPVAATQENSAESSSEYETSSDEEEDEKNGPTAAGSKPVEAEKILKENGSEKVNENNTTDKIVQENNLVKKEESESETSEEEDSGQDSSDGKSKPEENSGVGNMFVDCMKKRTHIRFNIDDSDEDDAKVDAQASGNQDKKSEAIVAENTSYTTDEDLERENEKSIIFHSEVISPEQKAHFLSTFSSDPVDLLNYIHSAILTNQRIKLIDLKIRKSFKKKDPCRDVLRKVLKHEQIKLGKQRYKYRKIMLKRAEEKQTSKKHIATYLNSELPKNSSGSNNDDEENEELNELNEAPTKKEEYDVENCEKRDRDDDCGIKSEDINDHLLTNNVTDEEKSRDSAIIHNKDLNIINKTSKEDEHDIETRMEVNVSSDVQDSTSLTVEVNSEKTDVDQPEPIGESQSTEPIKEGCEITKKNPESDSKLVEISNESVALTNSSLPSSNDSLVKHSNDSVDTSNPLNKTSTDVKETCDSSTPNPSAKEVEKTNDIEMVENTRECQESSQINEPFETTEGTSTKTPCSNIEKPLTNPVHISNSVETVENAKETSTGTGNDIEMVENTQECQGSSQTNEPLETTEDTSTKNPCSNTEKPVTNSVDISNSVETVENAKETLTGTAETCEDTSQRLEEVAESMENSNETSNISKEPTTKTSVEDDENIDPTNDENGVASESKSLESETVQNGVHERDTQKNEKDGSQENVNREPKSRHLEVDTCTTYGELFKKLDIFQKLPPVQEDLDSRPPLKISFDIYTSPSKNFSKTKRGPPNYRVIVVRPDEELPSPGQMSELLSRYPDTASVPYLFAVVLPSAVTLYRYSDVFVPNLLEDLDRC